MSRFASYHLDSAWDKCILRDTGSSQLDTDLTNKRESGPALIPPHDRAAYDASILDQKKDTA